MATVTASSGEEARSLFRKFGYFSDILEFWKGITMLGSEVVKEQNLTNSPKRVPGNKSDKKGRKEYGCRLYNDIP